MSSNIANEWIKKPSYINIYIYRYYNHGVPFETWFLFSTLVLHRMKPVLAEAMATLRNRFNHNHTKEIQICCLYYWESHRSRTETRSSYEVQWESWGGDNKHLTMTCPVRSNSLVPHYGLMFLISSFSWRKRRWQGVLLLSWRHSTSRLSLRVMI